MSSLNALAMDYPLCGGACAVGVATVETLEGGPPSTLLSYVLPEARSAVVFAVPLAPDLIGPFLGKQDRISHERDNFRTNFVASGIAQGLADLLRQKGHPSVAVSSNNVYRPEPLQHMEMVPDLSLRYLAVRSGLGHIGLSGNLITKQKGAAVLLGAVVTAADFVPTDPLPEEENYCDGCRLCMASCASGYMHEKKKDTVTIGGMEVSYSKRRDQLRCQFVCGGFSGLHASGKWSSWSPGRWEVPDSDENLLAAFMPGFNAYERWPEIEGGLYHLLMRKKLLLTCGHCQLICHPDLEERKRRHRLLTRSGVVVQGEDGSLQAVSAEEARQRMERLPPERRNLYEEV